MKLIELIHQKALEAQTEDALRLMDWDFDIDAMDDVRLRRGARDLRIIESMISVLYKLKPEVAHKLWETYCPYAQPGSLPSSVRRRKDDNPS